MYIIFKDKKSKRSHKAVGIKVFLTFYCLVIEGSRSGAGSGSESIPLTDESGSGSRRPKNMWIRWIRIRIRFRNTGTSYQGFSPSYNLSPSPPPLSHKQVVSLSQFSFVSPVELTAGGGGANS